MGISFAIPIDEAMRVADQLRSKGRVVRGRIGVSIGEVSKEVAEAIGLPKAQGALVRMVEPNSPADKAGLEAGDVIVKFDGKAIEKSSDLPRIVGSTVPGNKSTVGVFRRGSNKDLAVTVAEIEPDKQVAKRAAPVAPVVTNNLGLSVADLSEAKKKDAGGKGVLIEVAEAPSASADIRKGDVILAINNIEITSARQFNEIVSKLVVGKNVALLVSREGTASYKTVKPAAK